MSETNTPTNDPTELPPDPPPPDANPPPPPEPGEEQEQQRDAQGRFKSPDEGQARLDRRIGALRGQVSQIARERDQIAARLAAIEQGMAQQNVDPQQQQLEQFIEQRAEQKAALKLEEQRVRAFHEQGATRYPDWQQRCADLQGMGADQEIAKLLVAMPDGARVAGALRDDPDALERIAAAGSRDERAIALGQYAAKLELQPGRQVSRAPAPPPSLPGRSSPAPNIYQMDASAYANLLMKQALDAQTRT